jgi:hypothetical protein
LPFIVFDGALLKSQISGYSSVVDENVNLKIAGFREVILGGTNEMGWPGQRSNICLDYETGDSVLFGKGCGEFFAKRSG